MMGCGNPVHTLIDYHLHTSVIIDGRMSESEACQKALSLGIQEFAFTNHVMLNCNASRPGNLSSDPFRSASETFHHPIAW